MVLIFKKIYKFKSNKKILLTLTSILPIFVDDFNTGLPTNDGNI